MMDKVAFKKSIQLTGIVFLSLFLVIVYLAFLFWFIYDFLGFSIFDKNAMIPFLSLFLVPLMLLLFYVCYELEKGGM